MTAATESDLAGRLGAVGEAVVRWRRWLHAHPELSHHEHATAAYVEEQLLALGLVTHRPTPTSVIATLRGAAPGPTVAIRADIDALPVTEATGLPFASANEGVMHACGHDGHTAVLLGVATVLTGLRDELRGELRFVFQHSEETMPKGAPQLIAAGVLDGVDVIVGQHLWAPLPVGTIGVNHGALMAASDAFEVRFTGRGGHGGMPHDTVEAIPAAGAFIDQVHRLAAREFAPEDPVVVSVTTMRAGDVYNVIPSVATIGGTARSLSFATRERLAGRITALAHDLARLHRVEAEVDHRRGPSPLVNTPEVVDTVSAVGRALGHTVIETTPTMGGDDFAEYLREIPGAYVFVGATEPDAGTAFPHHHPRFDISERALPIATALLTRSALALLAAPGATR